jgi:MFS family permease
MIMFLLILLFIAFISLGLPDALGNIAWPLMYLDFSVPLSSSSLLFLPAMLGGIISSLIAGRLIKKFRPGWIIAISCFLTSVGMLGISFAPSVPFVILSALPLGLGAGGVDATINDFVAKNFTAKHMNWLHACYGIGTTIGPAIMLYVIQTTGTWRAGHRTVAIIQACLGVIFILTIGIWKKTAPALKERRKQNALKINPEDVIPASCANPKKAIARQVMAFAVYAGLESIIVTWGTTYFNIGLGNELILSGETATVYFFAFVVGRILAGFIVNRIGLKRIVFIGISISFVGIIMILLSSFSIYFGMIGMALIGIGYAPIYPCMMQQTPILVGKEASSVVIGYQMAVSNLCFTLLPFVTGLFGQYISLYAIPVVLGILAVTFFFIKVVPEFDNCRKVSSIVENNPSNT